MKHRTIILSLLCLILSGCIVKKVEPTPEPNIDSTTAQDAEIAMKVYARLLAEGIDQIDWSSEQLAGKDIQRLREAAREAAFRPLNDRMTQIDPWDPVEAERIGKEIQRGYTRAAKY